MNIFYVDSDPVAAAEMLPDNYCGSANYGGKMIVESCQMLANAYPDLSNAPLTQSGTIRKHAYQHHPCTKWAISSLPNFEWLLDHAIAMVVEKINRGGPKHFCFGFLNWCCDNLPNLPQKSDLPVALAMPECYKVKCPVESYRRYIVGEKLHNLPCFWTRNKPEWV